MASGSVHVAQVYAPTITHADEEYEEFPEHITKALNARTYGIPRKTYHNIAVGDFNAKVGSGTADEEFIGHMAVEYVMEGEKLYSFCGLFQSV
ncbi:hypothetical protein ANCDUO_18107 [Ancylostoma duodenale]|uniref:Endonuclease/exonuclease/phosphatase domain-containing protein n=1 Tax=Ancylostoma duodenale TaxID=51022 RepID=A0A0C2FT71_9BILA|nr:hypothetical protein ANCDUO_18107 [Ancylostoma duodenale]